MSIRTLSQEANTPICDRDIPRYLYSHKLCTALARSHKHLVQRVLPSVAVTITDKMALSYLLQQPLCKLYLGSYHAVMARPQHRFCQLDVLSRRCPLTRAIMVVLRLQPGNQVGNAH